MTPTRPLAALATACLLSACQAPPPRSADAAAGAAVRADCREQVDRQYNAQNRVDLTRRDERDFAYAGTYISGISSRGLGAEYGRDQAIDSCLRANNRGGQTPPSFGPALTPATTGGRGSSL